MAEIAWDMTEMDKTRILVVEDEAIISLYVRKILEGMDYAVVGNTASGEESVILARELRPDLVLMDIILSGEMDGIDAAAMIRRDCNIPVVFLTAHADVATVERARESEPFGYVLKPVNPQDLYSTIDTAIHRYRLEKELADKSRELERANEALRVSEAFHREVLTSISDAVFITDESGDFTYVCPNVNIIFGKSHEEAVALGNIQALLGASLFEPGSLQGRDELSNIEWTIKDAAGEVHELLVNVKRVSLGRGTILYTCRDVTAMKATAVALRRQDELIRSIFAAAPVGIGMVVDRVIREANDLLCQMTGYRREELVGENSRLLYPTLEDYEYVGKEKYRQITERGTGTVETRWRRKDGSVINVLLSSTPIHAGDLSAGVTFTALDITERLSLKDKLAASEEQYRQMFENMNSAVAVYRAVNGGRDFIITDFNRTAEKIESVGRKDVLGRPVREVFPGVADFGLLEVFRRVWETGVSEHHPVSFYRDERIAGWRENYVYRLPSGDVVAIYEDVTERKIAELALAESEGRYRRFIETSMEGVWAMDDMHRTTFVNSRMGDMLGYGTDEMLGKPVEDFMFPEDLEEHRRRMERRMAGDALHYERRFRRKDGSTLWTIVSPRPLYHPDGFFAGSFAMFTDITERKEADRRLEEQHRFLQTLIDTIPSPIFYKDREGRYTGCNRAFERLLGMEKAAILGMTVFDLGHPEVAQRYKEMDDALLERPGVQRYEWKVKDAAGDIRDVIFNKATYVDAMGKVAGIVGIISDITDRKKLENALISSLGQKEANLKEIHRRVRSTLQVMIGMLDKQAGEIDDGVRLDALRDTINRARAVAYIHENLYSSDNVDFIDFHEYIDQLARDLLQSYGGKGRDIRFTVQGMRLDLPIDKALACGLLLNEVISNSIKYAFPPGFSGVREIAVSIEERDGRSVIITAMDNGVGLPPDVGLGTGGTVGMAILPMLAKQLDVEIFLSRENGTSYRISFSK